MVLSGSLDAVVCLLHTTTSNGGKIAALIFFAVDPYFINGH
ncbi:MAG: hypothetical protein ACI8VC_000315 [Candidatus Endobugula sp.]|jgi:hypothetical protein